ncbi:hypothetical protein OKW42_006432 [Paraburkholderia sp. WC7.3d]
MSVQKSIGRKLRTSYFAKLERGATTYWLRYTFSKLTSRIP